MDLQQRISDWVDSHSEELLNDLRALIAIRSLKDESCGEGSPYGAEIRRCADKAMEICENYGLSVTDYDGYVVTADLGEDLEPLLDILAHLDIVHEGTGWATDPYVLTEQDGRLMGRGVEDDKGPALAAAMAMRCVKELGIELKGRTRLILGTDEESGSDDLVYYFSKEKSAPHSFTPDSGFPVYNVEKGAYRPTFGMKWKAADTATPRVARFEGGTRVNMVPGAATAEVIGIDAGTALLSLYQRAKDMDMELEVRQTATGCELEVFGVQAHASTPEEGKNAITALLKLLGFLPLAECGSTFYIKQFATRFPHGDYYGKAVGIAQSDDIAGPLTCNLSLLTLDTEGLRGQIDCRVPPCANDANCRMVYERSMGSIGIKAEGEMMAAHYTSADSDFIRGLLSSYEDVTGLKGECLSMGGMTYVHDVEGGVAFGAVMPGEPHGAHTATEGMSLEHLLGAVKIFALAIARICG